MTTTARPRVEHSERRAFRSFLAGCDAAEATAAVRSLIQDPPPWAADWHVFGALWAMPGGLALAAAAVDEGVIRQETFAGMTDQQRGRLVGWLDERGAR